MTRHNINTTHAKSVIVRIYQASRECEASMERPGWLLAS